MAKAVIHDIKPGFTKTINAVDFGNSSITSVDHSSIISNIEYSVGKIAETGYGIPKIIGYERVSRVMSVLPFRVRFTTIGLNSSYGPNNPAPIGIAIIGFNNYIL